MGYEAKKTEHAGTENNGGNIPRRTARQEIEDVIRALGDVADVIGEIRDGEILGSADGAVEVGVRIGAGKKSWGMITPLF
jgi:hypothetical protein